MSAEKKVSYIEEEATNSLRDQIDLIRQLNRLLANHPAGKNLVLTFMPEQICVEEDEVLVQMADIENHQLRLVPTRICDLKMDDIIRETQTIDLRDVTAIDHLSNVKVAKCLTRYNLVKKCVHIYD